MEPYEITGLLPLLRQAGVEFEPKFKRIYLADTSMSVLDIAGQLNVDPKVITSRRVFGFHVICIA